MSKIIVTSLDTSAPGSYRKRKRIMDAIAEMDNNDPASMAKAYQVFEDLVIPALSTDNGASVDEALDEMSADDFDALIQAYVGQETVPNPSTAS